MAQDRHPAPPQVADAVVAAAAPPGGALGIVRVGGGGALAATRGFLFSKGNGPLEPRRATLCEARVDGALVDEVVATYFPANASPTGEDLVEIACHGSSFIVESLIRAAVGAGARHARPGEFTQRAYLNGKLDLAQAEAVCDLIAARTAGAHKTALSQLKGGLSAEIAKLRAPILELLVRIEASLDHPEDDLPSMPAREFDETARAAEAGIRALAATHERGRLLKEGARVAIVGAPNAGKSSLMNALLGRDRAIVCDEPGTTRDTLEESIDLEGMKAVLIDTAGVRDSVESEVEKIGIDRTREALKHSDVALLVVDGSKEPSENDRRVHADLLNDASAEGRLCIPVLSKADLPIRAAFPELAPVEISVVTREGLESLAGRIRAAVRSTDQPEVMITSLRHKEALAKCAEALRAAAVESSSPRWEDRAASRLREALRALDEIAGPAAPDEVLAEIFSRFCVGK